MTILIFSFDFDFFTLVETQENSHKPTVCYFAIQSVEPLLADTPL